VRTEQAPLLEEEDAVADPLHLAEQVRVEQHRRSARAEGDEQLAHGRNAGRIEAGGGLVEQHEIRIA